MSETLPLPAGHPQQGYVEPDVSFTDGAGVPPQEEIDWATARDSAREAEVAAVAAAEDTVATAVREERLDHDTPRLSSLFPGWSQEGDPDFTVHVRGNGFVEGSQATWNTQYVPTTFVSDTLLKVPVEPAVLAVGFHTVAVEGVEGELLFEHKGTGLR